MSRFYSEAYKWSLYEKFYSGFTLTELCEISGITDKPLREWFRNFGAQYAQAALVNLREVRQESVQLRKKIKKAQKEMEIFQSTSIIEEIPESLRISCAQKLLKPYSSNQVCHSLKIRKSNLYYHILRKPEATDYEKHDRELRPVIQRICDESPKRIGAEKIRQKLIEKGFSVSKRKVLKLLREISPRKQTSQEKSDCSFSWHSSHDNILARNFSPPEPNMAWLSDITTIKTDSGKFYLCVILDLFSRKIIAARLSAKEDASLLCCTFQDAFQVRGRPEGLIFHSDQGGQYRSCKFQDLLRSHNIKQSFSKPGVPFDNAPMESFFASLKVEEIYRFRYAGINDLAASLRSYITFYNNERPHTSIGGMTPVEAEDQYFQQESTVEEINRAPLA